LVVRALVLVKEADMAKTLESLGDAEVDAALKYVYWGLSSGQNATSLLKWHAALIEKNGVGSIMRVLTERKVADNKAL
jgi:actin related protein 2/3 complex subunit 5